MATLPIKLDKGDFDRGIQDVRNGLTSLIGPLAASAKGFTVLGVAIGAVVVAVGAGVVAITKIGQALIKLNADMLRISTAAEEVDSRFNVVFGEGADEARAQLELLATATGRTALELESGAASLQSFFVASRISRDDAQALSVTLAKLAVDLESFSDIAGGTEETFRRIESGLKGSAEAMDALNVNVREGEVRAFAFREGWTESNRVLTAQEKIWARFGLIIESTTDQQLDAIRTGDSLRNIQRRINAEYENSARIFGQDLRQAFRTFLVDGVGVFQVLASIRLGLKVASLAGVEFFERVTAGFRQIRNFVNAFPVGFSAAMDTLRVAFTATEMMADSIELDVLTAQLRALGQTEAEVRDLVDIIEELAVTMSAPGSERRDTVLMLLRQAVDDFTRTNDLDQFLQAMNDAREGFEGASEAAEDTVSAIDMVRLKAAELASGFSGVAITGLRTAFDGFSTGIGDAVAGLENLGDVSKRIWQQMISDIVAASVRVASLRFLIAPLFGGSTFGAQVAAQLGFQGAAQGMVQPFARGGFPSGFPSGIINSPTIFGLAGEAGTELGLEGRRGRAIAPLEQDPSSGALGVRIIDRGQGGGGNVSIVNHQTFMMPTARDAARMSGRQVENQLRGVQQRVRG